MAAVGRKPLDGGDRLALDQRHRHSAGARRLTVHIDGKATRSCAMPVSLVEGKAITTIEGLSPDGSHPLQKAWVAEQVPQCGYCQSGQIMQAAELLASNKNPTRAQIVEHMDGNLCRCGTYLRIISAIQRAAREG